jgi:D-alanyl-D-alanine carboxypeptidase (penicillin-binding protein 5/6)
LTTAVTLVPTPPILEGQAYLLQDFDSGRILIEKNIDGRIEPASLTKLMTAYLIFERLQQEQFHLTDTVKISEKAWRMTGSRMYLEINSVVPLEMLLKGMIIQSGNDAAVALAEWMGGSEEAFVQLMNQHAKQLGLTNTHYANSTGLPDPQHYSTARDLANMARLIIRDFPEYYQWYSQREFTYNNITQTNRNTLLWHDKEIDGVKTGFTENAGFCLIASAKRNSMRLISVMLGAKNQRLRTEETLKMLSYGFSFFETHLLYKANETLSTERVWYGSPNILQLGLAKPFYITIAKGQYNRLSATMRINKKLVAPIQIGDTYGTVKVSLVNKVIAEQPLIALYSVEQGSWLRQFIDHFLIKFK